MSAASLSAHLLQLLPHIMQSRYGDIVIFFIVQVIKGADSNFKCVNILTSQLAPAHFMPIICQGKPATADSIITNSAQPS